MQSGGGHTLQDVRDQTTRHQLSMLVLFFTLAMAAILGCGIAFGNREALLIIAGNAVVLLAILVLQRAERLAAASLLICLAILGSAVWGTATNSRGLIDSTALAYLLAVVFGALLLSRRLYLLLLGFAIASLLVIGFRRQLGLSTGYDVGATQPIDVAVAIVLVIVAGWCVRSQHGMLWDALRRARTHERDLVASEDRWRMLVGAAPDWILQLDREGTVVFANRPGLRRGGVVGCQLSDLVVVSDDEATTDTLARVLAGEGPVSVDVRAATPDGVRHLRLRMGPIHDPDGVAGAIVQASDITEHRRLQQQLHQTRRLESIGQLAGGVAHDFNNILTVIRGYSELAREKLPADHPSVDDLETIDGAVVNARSLTRQILAFSRRRMLHPEPVVLADTLGGLRRMLERLIGEHITLAADLAGDLPPLLADPGSLEQVIMNLVVNARDAINDHPDRGPRTITLETRRVEVGEDPLGRLLDLAPGVYGEITVSDTGIGMSREVREHIFEPFFTTKETGTGLGLSTVFGIVRQSGGAIRVFSEPGCGSTFKIYWPTTETGSTPTAKAEEAPPLHTGDETVLVVEDEDLVRRVSASALAARGYEVATASDGEEALALLEAGATVDAVVTDVVMPGLDGFALASRLPSGLPVLFTSGYTEASWLVADGLPPGSRILHKPYTPDELARRLRELFDAFAGRKSSGPPSTAS